MESASDVSAKEKSREGSSRVPEFTLVAERLVRTSRQRQWMCIERFQRSGKHGSVVERVRVGYSPGAEGPLPTLPPCRCRR